MKIETRAYNNRGLSSDIVFFYFQSSRIFFCKTYHNMKRWVPRITRTSLTATLYNLPVVHSNVLLWTSHELGPQCWGRWRRWLPRSYLNMCQVERIHFFWHFFYGKIIQPKIYSVSSSVHQVGYVNEEANRENHKKNY